MQTVFRLNGYTKVAIRTHDGLFTRSYQEARADYDARIRSWDIEYKDRLFHVTDSNQVTEQVYFEKQIKNCSCLHFVENQAGTCMHIEAVKLLEPSSMYYPNIRPIAFINSRGNFQLSHKPLEFEKHRQTPAIKAYLELKEVKVPPDGPTDFPDVDVFKEFGITLFDFQRESVLAMMKVKKSILTLKMGLGKTICTLVCEKLLDKPRNIIVCPASLKLQWEHEINRFNLGTSLVVSRGSDIHQYFDQKFLIISYEMLLRHPSLLEIEYDTAVLDEIQKIKNNESKVWGAISKLKSEFTFTLTGTPIQNSINDLLSIISFLNPKELKPDWKFYEEFCDCSKARVLGVRQDRMEDLKNRISRYLINPVIDYSKFPMPKKSEELIITGLTVKQQELHENFFSNLKMLMSKAMDKPLTQGERNALNGLQTKCRMAMTDARLFDLEAEPSERFLEIEKKIKYLTDSGKKVIVYSEWIKTLDLLQPFLLDNNIKFVEYNGTRLDDRKKDRNLQEFIHDIEVKVFLSSDSGGQGLDGLQLVCSEVIHVEKVWNPAKIEQRNGRVVRQLQPAKIVNVYRYESNSEIEKMMTDNHVRKFGLIADLLK